MNAKVNCSITELDIALERAMAAITTTNGEFTDLALRSVRFNDLTDHYAKRLGVRSTGNLQDVIALTLLTGIVTERLLAEERGDTSRTIATAIEFGYRACEKGMNLQATLEEGVQ